MPDERPPADPRDDADALPAPEAETILLVEDEDVIRMLALHALQAEGYAVLDAEDGEQALRAVRAFAVPVRLLVTDVVMPGLGGRELADRLRAEQPWVRVLYMSGYTDDEVLRHGIAASRVDFLQKPFAMSTLTQRVREALDAADAR